MANTTQELVEIIAPELAGIDADLFNLVFADISAMITSDTYGDNQERAQRYLMAHTLTLLNPNGSNSGGSIVSGNVTAQRVKDVSINTSDIISAISDKTRYDTTKYGVMFMSIVNASILPFGVFTP